MKRLIVSVAAAMFLSAPLCAYAAEEVYSTDIGALIDSQPIQAYNIGGNMYVIAEELRSYGFGVDWDEEERRLDIYRNGTLAITTLEPDEINIKKADCPVNEKLYDVYPSDISVYVAGERVEGKSIDGRMLVKLRELSRYGTVEFDAERRLAQADIAKSCLEWDFNQAEKQTLVIDENTVYEGQVLNGVPYGVGKMTTVEKDRKLRVDYRSLGSDWQPYEQRQVYEERDLTTCTLAYFKDGKPVQTVYTSGDIVYDSVKRDSVTIQDLPFKQERLEYYEDTELTGGRACVHSASDLQIYYESFCKAEDGSYYNDGITFLKDGHRYEYGVVWDDDYLYGIRINSLRVDGRLTSVMPSSEPVKFTLLINDKTALDENGNMYVWGREYGYTTIDRPALIRENVRDASLAHSENLAYMSGDYFDLNYYFVTDDNKLYRTVDLFDPSKDIFIDDDVKLFEKNSRMVYITDSEDTLYRITDFDYDTGSAWEFSPKKLYSNVKDFSLVGDTEQLGIVNTDSDAERVFMLKGDRVELNKNGELLLEGQIIDSGIQNAIRSYWEDMLVYIKEDGSLWVYSKSQKVFAQANKPQLLGEGFVSADASRSILAQKEDGSLWLWNYTGDSPEPVMICENCADYRIDAEGASSTVISENGDIIIIDNKTLEQTKFDMAGRLLPMGTVEKTSPVSGEYPLWQ